MPNPKADLEQYATPAGIAAELAYIALGKGDLADRRVLDAGCGNGILGIAAKLLGAGRVVGVDRDPAVCRVAERNGERAGVEVTWVTDDVTAIRGRFDTVLMNPPFGSQTRHADLPFLDAAIALAPVVYSFHNGTTEDFVRKRIESRGAQVTDRVAYEFPLPKTFGFQRDEVRRIPVVLFRSVVPKG